MPGLTNVRGMGLAFQANDPYVTDFTLAILHFQENGFLANLERKWWESSSGCTKEQDTGKKTFRHLVCVILTGILGG